MNVRFRLTVMNFMQFFRYGLGVVAASLAISTVYLYVRYLG